MNVLGRLGQVVGHDPLAGEERLIRLVTLEQINITFGVITDSGEQFETVGKLDDIIIRAERERVSLDLGVFLGGQNDQGDFAGCSVFAKHLHEREAVDVGHHEVLEDQRRLNPFRLGDGLCGIFAIVEDDVLLTRDHPAHGFTDDRLIIDEQDGDFMAGEADVDGGNFRGGLASLMGVVILAGPNVAGSRRERRSRCRSRSGAGFVGRATSAAARGIP